MKKKIRQALCLLAAFILLLPAFSLADEKEPSPIPLIPEDQLTPTPKGIHHYMLICLDSWDPHLEDKNDFLHTDGLVLVTADEFSGRIILTSIMRDSLIERWDGKFGRINNEVGYYQRMLWEKGEKNDTASKGVEQLLRTLNTHLDLNIEKYIVVDFKEVQDIIDALGGVDITMTKRETSRLRSFGIDIPNAAGTYHVAGYAAVIYMRIRKVHFEYYDENGVLHKEETQDVGRNHRTRNVLSTVIDMLSDITEEDAWELVDTVLDNTELTNLTNNDLIEGVRLAMLLKGTPVEQFGMPMLGTFETVPVAGMDTEQIDWITNREALHTFLFDNSFDVTE